MKTLKLLSTFIIIAIFVFKPSGLTQISPNTTTKEQENKAIKAKLDIKQDSIISSLKKAANDAKKPKVVYITKWRVKPTDTVYVNGNPEHCDTLYFVVKKNNLLKRIFTRQQADTIRLE